MAECLRRWDKDPKGPELKEAKGAVKLALFLIQQGYFNYFLNS